MNFRKQQLIRTIQRNPARWLLQQLILLALAITGALSVLISLL